MWVESKRAEGGMDSYPIGQPIDARKGEQLLVRLLLRDQACVSCIPGEEGLQLKLQPCFEEGEASSGNSPRGVMDQACAQVQ